MSPSEIVRKLKIAAVLPHLSDLGAVVFTAAGILALVLAAAEAFAPGFAASYVSPAAVFAVLAASAALSMLAPAPPPARRQRIAGAVFGLAAVLASFGIAWYHFSPAPGERPFLAAAAGLTTLVVFLTLGPRKTF